MSHKEKSYKEFKSGDHGSQRIGYEVQIIYHCIILITRPKYRQATISKTPSTYNGQILLL